MVHMYSRIEIPWACKTPCCPWGPVYSPGDPNGVGAQGSADPEISMHISLMYSRHTCEGMVRGQSLFRFLTILTRLTARIEPVNLPVYSDNYSKPRIILDFTCLESCNRNCWLFTKIYPPLPLGHMIILYFPEFFAVKHEPATGFSSLAHEWKCCKPLLGLSL